MHAQLRPTLVTMDLTMPEMDGVALAQQKLLMRSWQSLPPDAAIDATVAEFGKAFATGEPQRYMAAFVNRKR